jgi:hypothetical protein
MKLKYIIPLLILVFAGLLVWGNVSKEDSSIVIDNSQLVNEEADDTQVQEEDVDTLTEELPNIVVNEPTVEVITGTVGSINIAFDCLPGEETPTTVVLRDGTNIVIDQCNSNEVKGTSPLASEIRRGDIIAAEVELINNGTYTIYGSSEYSLSVIGIAN